MDDTTIRIWFVPDPAEQFANPYLAMGNNPVMYTDPDGQFVMFAIAIGAITNMIIQGLSGNVNSIQDAGVALGIGGASAGVGFGMGTVISGAGFFAGAGQGMLGGGSAGFTSGIGNAYYNGASPFEGLNAGLKAGGIGAAMGGLIGGISGGIRANKMGLDFWTGELNNASLDINPYNPELLASKEDILDGGSNLYENEKVDFSKPEAFRDVIQKLRYIRVRGRLPRPVGDFFDLNTISAADGWSPMDQGAYWTKDFSMNNLKFVVNTLRRAPNLLVTNVIPGSGGDAYSISAVGLDAHGINAAKLVWVKTYSNLVYQELRNYVLHGEIPFFFNPHISVPIPNSER